MSVSVTITGSSTACLYCNTEDVAFGPVFDSEYDATDFLEWLPLDARTYNPSALVEMKSRWENRDGETTAAVARQWAADQLGRYGA